MSKCKISISTLRTNYQFGDTVKGHVTVEVDKECQCDALSLEKFWSTHGKGNRSRGASEKITLFQGVWQPGTYTYAFSFELNEGPFSYHGHYINVDWYLAARADIPWAIDPKDELEFILEKNSDDVPDNIKGYEVSHSGDKTLALNNIGYFKYFPIVFVIAGLLMIYFEHAYLFGGIFTIAGSVIFYKMIQSSIAERKLGEVKCEIDKHSLRPGEYVNISVAFTPASNLQINAASIKLIGREIAVSGSGTKKTTHTHTFHAEEVPILMQGRFSKDMPIRDKRRLEIPLDAAPSFSTSDNRIEWSLAVVIDIPRWPDWENSLSIIVRP